MNIVVNTRLLLKNRLEGIGWFTFETLKRITISHPEHTFIFVFDRKYDDEFIFSDNIIPVIAGPPTRHPVLWYYWFERVIPRILKDYNADLFISPDGYNSLRTDIDTLIVLHDINFYHRPKDLPFLIRHYYNRFFSKYAHKANRIVTVSEYSKADISKSFGINPDKIDVVFNGANKMFMPVPDEMKQKAKAKYTGGKDFFVFVGALHARKNISGLIKAFNEFKKETGSDLCLVIIGSKMFKSSELESTVSSSPFIDDIIFTGRLEPVDLSLLMGSALALVFVPFFEGFGIPVIEAFNSDTPVITSNVTSLPEIAVDAAILVDPYSAKSICDAMISIYEDHDLRNQLIENGRIRRIEFSWEATALKLWQAIEKVKSTNSTG